MRTAQEEMIYVHHTKIKVSVSIDPIYLRNKARPKIFDDQAGYERQSIGVIWKNLKANRRDCYIDREAWMLIARRSIIQEDCYECQRQSQ